MGDKFKRFVEWGTDCTYVPMGAKCDICQRKLGVFATGFWSMNTTHVADGNVCKACHGKIATLIAEKDQWMTREMKKESQLGRYTEKTWPKMAVKQIRQLLELKEQADRGELAKYGESASAYLIVQEAFQIEPTAVQVGVVRAKKLAKTMVVYGRVEQGVFAKSDAVRIDGEGGLLTVHVLETYEDDGANPFEHHVRAHMGRQKLAEDQAGWLLLDLEWGVFPGDRVVK